MSVKTDTRHLYLRVIESIKKDVETGKYKENEKLPSEFELAKQLGVSRATLREALRVLEEDNVITRRHGVGTFVNPKPLFTSGIEQLTSVTNMIKQAGMEPGTIFLKTMTEWATEEDIDRFSCEADEKMVTIERVRTANGDPVVYCIDTMPEKYFPRDFTYDDISLFYMLEKEGTLKITHALADISPLGYHEKVSSILQCDPETALLVLKQLHVDEQETPILYSVNYFKADKFRFQVLRKRV